MAFRIRFEGGRDLERAMMDLTRVAAKGVARRSLIKGGQPIAEAGAQNAPVEYGDLAESYAVGTKVAGKRRPRKESDVEVYVGPNDPADIFTEFGTVRQAAQPHLRPAFDGQKEAAFREIAEAMSVEVQRSLARARRKAARAARRG